MAVALKEKSPLETSGQKIERALKKIFRMFTYLKKWSYAFLQCNNIDLQQLFKLMRKIA